MAETQKRPSGYASEALGLRGWAEMQQPAEVSNPAETEIPQMAAGPLHWLQNHTRTRDSHWRERGAHSPYRSFPDMPYFRSIMEYLEREPIVFIEKSRNMMLSWLCVGYFTHVAMTNPGVEVLFQSQNRREGF